MTIFATKEQVDFLKKRTLSWKADDFAGCDPNMKPIIDILSDWDGLATTWCCEGHLENSKVGHPYIMFAVMDDTGFTNIKCFYEAIRDKLLKDSDGTKQTVRPFDWSLNFSTRLWGFDEIENTPPYPVMVITCHYRTEAAKKQFFDTLHGFFFVEKETSIPIK